jgi:hypothetical protein
VARAALAALLLLLFVRLRRLLPEQLLLLLLVRLLPPTAEALPHAALPLVSAVVLLPTPLPVGEVGSAIL